MAETLNHTVVMIKRRRHDQRQKLENLLATGRLKPTLTARTFVAAFAIVLALQIQGRPVR